MSRPVTPAGRRRDRIALALLLAGVILAAIPALQLAQMSDGRGMITASGRAPRNMERAERLVMFTSLGGLLVLAGVAAGVWSFARHHTSRHDPPPDAEADHT